MWTRIRKAAVVFLVVLIAALAAAQLVRPGRAILATDSSHTLQSLMGAADPLVAVMDRSCGECHSNATLGGERWYTKVAPLSWVMARTVNVGRKALNFSEWTTYTPEQRRAFLLASCQDAMDGTMPMRAYTRFRPDARMSGRDIETICAAARQPEPNVASSSEAQPPSQR